MRPIISRLLGFAAALAACLVLPAVAQADPSTQVTVRFKTTASDEARHAALSDAGLNPVATTRVGGAAVFAAHGPRRASVAASRLKSSLAVAWAEVAMEARTTAFVPNDPGIAGGPSPASGWAGVQWALTGPFGIRMPDAWSQVTAAGGDGGRGVVVAVLDSGVAYEDRGPFRRSPDLAAARFVRGYDFVHDDTHPNDLLGHGTTGASLAAADTNNGYGTAGVAYAARIMPVQVLSGDGIGNVVTIARGVRYAARKGAKVANMSLELFVRDATNQELPASISDSRVMRSALRYARSKGMLIVAAAGNSFSSQVPNRRDSTLLFEVGASTERGCLADYSNHGPGLDVVAPGGGVDAPLPDPHCLPDQPQGRDLSAVSFPVGAPSRFTIPGKREGTSFAAPHVAGVAALVVASGVLGRNPSPARIAERLRATATDLGAPGRDRLYGSGLVNAQVATLRG